MQEQRSDICRPIGSSEYLTCRRARAAPALLSDQLLPGQPGVAGKGHQLRSSKQESKRNVPNTRSRVSCLTPDKHFLRSCEECGVPEGAPVFVRYVIMGNESGITTERGDLASPWKVRRVIPVCTHQVGGVDDAYLTPFPTAACGGKVLIPLLLVCSLPPVLFVESFACLISVALCQKLLVYCSRHPPWHPRPAPVP